MQNHYILSEMKQCSQQAGEKQTSVQHHTNWLQPYRAISLGHIMWVTSLHLEYPIRIFNMTETTQINFQQINLGKLLSSITVDVSSFPF